MPKDTRFDASDFRSQIPRFSPENLPGNLALAEYVAQLAEKKGNDSCPHRPGMAAGAKAVYCSHSGHKKVSRIQENIGGAEISFAPEELAEIRENLERFEIIGARYPKAQEELTGK